MANTKETLNRIVQIANNEEAAVARFNDNVDITNRAITDSLSRTGKGNNAMEASLDMNGNAIINTVMRPIEKRLDGDVVVWGEVKKVLTYTNLIGQNLDKIALVGNNINKVIAVADRIDRVSYLADNLWALSEYATKEYVDTTEQEIISNFMSADTALQTQINGQAVVLAEVKEDAMSNMAEIADLKLSKQDKLVAGANIQIQDNVISAIGGGGGGEVVVNSDSYRSLDETQKAQLLADGTYKGSEVADGEVFTEYEGKFVEYSKELNPGGEIETTDTTHYKICFDEAHGYFVSYEYSSTAKRWRYVKSENGFDWEPLTEYIYGTNDISSPNFIKYANGFLYSNSTANVTSTTYSYSSDGGITWNTLDSLTGAISHIAYGNGVYVVHYSNNTAAVSLDGISFTDITTPSKAYGVCFNNGTFIIGSTTSGKFLYKSTDGVSWEQVTDLPFIPNSGSCISARGYFYMIGRTSSSGSGSYLYRSVDGASWEQVSDVNFFGYNYSATDGTNIILYDSSSSSKISYVLLENDELSTTNNYSGIGEICYGDGIFVSGSARFSLTPFYEHFINPLSYTKEEADAVLTEELTGVLKNLSTANKSLSIAGTASASTYSTNVGYNSTARSNGTGLGYGAHADGVGAIAIGTGDTVQYTKATGFHSIAIGPGGSGYPSTEATADYAIQLGHGTNSVANTMNVGLSNTLNVQLLDANGNIPTERLVNAPVPDVPKTNCITEIPQDIKLELVDGTLTLKTGSVIHVPSGLVSGAASFTSVTLSTDRSVTLTTTPSADTQMMVFCSSQGALNVNLIQPVNVCTSGTTAPSATPYVFWNTTNNRILYNGTSPTSLPIAIITQGSDGVTKSIDKIFNGFGYIGTTVFALPGVKGLIPDGRNSDGSLNNITFENTSVCTSQVPSGGDYYLRAASNYIHVFPYDTYYDPDNNFIRKNDGTPQSQMFAGLCSVRSGAFSYFNPKGVFRAADGNELRTVVSSYRNGDNWYRAWSDGWIEQGGVHAAGTAVSITFLKAFTTTNYTPLLTAYFTPEQSADTPVVTARAKTSMSICSAGSGTKAGTWYACGF